MSTHILPTDDTSILTFCLSRDIVQDATDECEENRLLVLGAGSVELMKDIMRDFNHSYKQIVACW